MKANNLTICIDAPCNKKCPYCVSKMTFYPEPNENLFCGNMQIAVKMANLASVSSVLITSKGEPLNDLSTVENICKIFYNFPLELQTNGLKLKHLPIEVLEGWGINTIAFSIDKYQDMFSFKEQFDDCKKRGINVRITVVLSDLWTPPDGYNFLADCTQLGIKQVTLRKMTVPSLILITEESIKTAEWIKEHSKEKHEMFLGPLYCYELPENLVRQLPFGPSVYDMEGIAVTTIDYCIQESNNTEDIRSLIYHQDGHMYTSWDKKASILF
jgi:hypothetical protein